MVLTTGISIDSIRFQSMTNKREIEGTGNCLFKVSDYVFFASGATAWFEVIVYDWDFL